MWQGFRINIPLYDKNLYLKMANQVKIPIIPIKYSTRWGEASTLGAFFLDLYQILDKIQLSIFSA